jgi:membrane protease YdiL (CAAX protease family)
VNNNTLPTTKKSRFQFYEHPWISLLIIVLLLIVLVILDLILGLGEILGLGNFLIPSLLLLFVIVPFVLHIPKGKRSYKEFLSDIRLSHVQPLLPLLLLGISCWLILAICQATGSIIYGLSQGQPLTTTFLRYVFDITVELPPASWSLVTSIPSIFEEVLWRGIILTLFLSWYSKGKSIVISTVGFGLLHLFDLLPGSGHEVVWVLCSVVWAVIIGLFYGYVVLKSDSLLPAMLVHWLGNTFIYAFTRYIQLNASVTTNAIYGVIITLGLVPTILMILWVRFVVVRWTSGFRPR